MPRPLFKIFDIEMGSKAPTLERVEVKGVDWDEENRLIDAVDVAIHLEYSGGFAIGIDVAMAYDKTAQLTAKGNGIHVLSLPSLVVNMKSASFRDKFQSLRNELNFIKFTFQIDVF